MARALQECSQKNHFLGLFFRPFSTLGFSPNSLCHLGAASGSGCASSPPSLPASRLHSVSTHLSLCSRSSYSIESRGVLGCVATRCRHARNLPLVTFSSHSLQKIVSSRPDACAKTYPATALVVSHQLSLARLIPGSNRRHVNNSGISEAGGVGCHRVVLVV